MKSTAHTFPALLVLGICIQYIVQTVESQHIPNRCICLKSKNGDMGPFSDFTVILKRPGCTRDEIIVTLKKGNKQVCLSPHGPQGKRLLKCWHRKQELGKIDKKTAAVNIREKCMCLRETDGVPMRRVSNFNVINSGPHCYKVQIMINFNERKKKKVCLASGKVKRKQKKPKTA
ncbi:growth-regulated alpha protein-like [Silurus meridionalis]|nr:growth-regulated alpha protein-like [Silurus meridionalis]